MPAQWQRLHDFQTASNLDLDALLLQSYLIKRAAGGPTAASGAFGRLKWLQAHMGLSLPLDSLLLRQWSSPAANHVVDQADPIDPGILNTLLDVAAHSTDNVRRHLAFLHLRLVVSGLRYAHALRATFRSERSDERSETWFVDKSKKEDTQRIPRPLPNVSA